MVITNVLDAEIIDCEVEPDGSRIMGKEARRVWKLVVSMLGKTFLEELVGKDTGLWEAIHALPDLHVNMSVADFALKVVMFDDVGRKKGNGHTHVLIPIERSLKVHVLNVGSTKFCTRRADSAIPQKFGRHHVSSACGEFEWVVDEVAADGDPNTIGILLLWTMVDDDTGIRDGSVFGNCGDVGVV